MLLLLYHSMHQVEEEEEESINHHPKRATSSKKCPFNSHAWMHSCNAWIIPPHTSTHTRAGNTRTHARTHACERRNQQSSSFDPHPSHPSRDWTTTCVFMNQKALTWFRNYETTPTPMRAGTSRTRAGIARVARMGTSSIDEVWDRGKPRSC